jgi:DNA-nicking Smr family endonuclease
MAPLSLATLPFAIWPEEPAPELPATPEVREVKNPALRREREKLINSIPVRFPRIDACTASAICDEADWSELQALQLAEEIVEQCQRADMKRPLTEEDSPAFHHLCAQFPALDQRLISLAVRRAGYIEEDAKEYLINEPMLKQLEAKLQSLDSRKAEFALAALTNAASAPQRTTNNSPPRRFPAPRKTKTTLTIDLHGYPVDEAQDLVLEIMETLDSKWTKVNFITGQGHHSTNGIAKIRPMVLQLLGDRGYSRQVHPKNPGIIELMPKGQKFCSDSSSEDDEPKISGGIGIVVSDTRNVRDSDGLLI